MKARIFDLRRYSIYDGPGIRTVVFFKGCPLRCLWCHNPESISNEFELMHWPGRCQRSLKCSEVCPLKAVIKQPDGTTGVDRKICNVCGICARSCPYDAMQVVGQDMTVEEIVEEVEKDRIFYEQSGGGVTLSGGEPFFQPEALEELIDALKARNISVALDTSGFAPEGLFQKIASKVNQVLFDLKLMDSQKHKEFTGVPNELILSNLRKLSSTKTDLWIRIALIGGVNDDDGNIKSTIKFLSSLNGAVNNIGLLPYHRGGMDKAGRLGKRESFREFSRVSEKRLLAIEQAFSQAGFQIRKGG